MPEVKIVKRWPLAGRDLQVVMEKGGVFIDQAKVEWAKWVTREYETLQEFLNKKLREHNKKVE